MCGRESNNIITSLFPFSQKKIKNRRSITTAEIIPPQTPDEMPARNMNEWRSFQEPCAICAMPDPKGLSDRATSAIDSVLDTIIPDPFGAVRAAIMLDGLDSW